MLSELSALPEAHLGTADSAALAALARILKRAAAELQAEFAATGNVDYTYVGGAAHEALGDCVEPTDLALRTGLALKHILVDEFQDTSLAQYELLSTLTAGWQAGDGRTLFLVGDPMQSIYRFRDAEVGLFIAARERGIHDVKLESLRLARNFRSSRALVEWCNAAFARLFPAVDGLRDGAVAFSASRSASREPPAVASAEEAVTLQVFPGDPAGEARAVAERIARLKSTDPRASVALLVAAHAHATPIVRELQALGVETLGVDLVPLAERPVVRDLVQLTRALYDLGDRGAWLAVLRAPWCGARLVTLTALSAGEEAALLWEALHDEQRLARCAANERLRLLRVREVLARARAARDRQPPADWLEGTWLQLGAADAYTVAELEDARAFFTALAARAAAFAWRGPADFEALLQNLYHTPQATGSTPVQVMTIHRAKGLEFDHVLVPALEHSSRSGERSLLGWVDLPRAGGGSDLLMAPAPTIGHETHEGVGALIRRLLATRAAHERTRLIYVAATRARRSLYLSGAPKVRADGTLRPEPRTLLGMLWPALGERFEVVPPAAARASASPPLALRRLREAWHPPELAAAPQLPRLPLAGVSLETGGSGDSIQSPEFQWVGGTQRIVGIIVHRLLAAAAEAGAIPEATATRTLRATAVEELRLHGVAELERPQAADLVVAALARTFADERGRWILSALHRDAHSEWELTGLVAGRLRRAVLDRCFIDTAGTRWVIDYKTSSHQGGNLEGFLAEELRRYREQLRDYMALAAALGSEPVRGALYFPLLGAFRELL
jgi:ATP-dependent helicase/nuclease subunit A